MVNPEESAPGARRVFGRARRRDSAIGRARVRAENSHSVRRAPVRVWVERSGPHPLTMSTPLTAKEVRGYDFGPTGAASADERGAPPPPEPEEKRGTRPTAGGLRTDVKLRGGEGRGGRRNAGSLRP